MSLKPLKPCKYPGCPELIRDSSYCLKHKTIANREYNQYHRDPDFN